MRLFTAVGLLVAMSRASAAAAPPEDPKPGDSVPSSGFKIAFWYERDRPAESFRYQAYDLRKGEYDPHAVGRWLDVIGARFPRYSAYVKDVTAVSGPDKSVQETLTAAILREKERVGSIGRRASGPPPAPGPRAAPDEHHAAGPRPAQPTGPPANQARGHSEATTARTPAPDLGRLMHPVISGYPRAGSSGRGFAGGAIGGSSGFGSAPSSPFPSPYSRPHP